MESVHDLTAAYALDALDPDERREYERHLGECEPCRAELAGFRDAAGALAFGVASPEPPPELRTRILAAVRTDGAKVIPLRSRRPFQLAVGLAAAAAFLAIGLGIWATSLARSLDEEREARSELASLLADPQARELRLARAKGRLVVDADGDAALLVSNLRPAPSKRTYEVWVIDREGPKPAGLFDADGGRDAVLLSRRVPRDAIVAVTLERAGGVERPTSAPLFSAST